MTGALLLVLLASGLRPALGVALGEPLVPDSIFYQQSPDTGDMYVLCQQGVELAGQLIGTAVAPTPLDCAEKCWDDAECEVFNHIDCADVQTSNCTECSLYATNCTIAPVTVAPPTGVLPRTVTSGFPIRYELSDMPGFTAQAGQGVPGADIQCAQSLIPGKCALGSLTDAVITCVTNPDCQAVVHYFNGTDGCSEPVSLLVRAALTQRGAFMSPHVATLSRVAAGSLLDTTLTSQDGTVVVPPPEELPPAGVPTDSDATLLGCIIAEHVLMAGSEVATLDGLESAEDCCRACRNATRCNLYNYCGLAGGCSYTMGPRMRALAGGQCQLLYSDTVGPPYWFPPAVIAKGADVPFTGGAPLALSAPPVPGYDALPGRNQFAFTGGSFNCSFTEFPQAGECAVLGTMEEVAARCNATRQCAGMIISPGRSPGTVQANFKSLINSTSMGLSPSNGLYLKASIPIDQPAGQPGSSGGLSTGAIVGIAVGATAAAAAGGAAVWLLLHHRRAVRASGVAAPKPDDDAGLEADKEAGDSAMGGSVCGEVVVLGADDSQVAASASSAPPSAGTGHSAGSRSSGDREAAGSSAAGGGGPRGVRHPAHGASTPMRTVSPFAAGPRGGANGGAVLTAGGERRVQHPAGVGQGGSGLPRTSPFSSGPRGARTSLDIARVGMVPPPSPFTGGPRSARPSLDYTMAGSSVTSSRTSLDGARPGSAARLGHPDSKVFGNGSSDAAIAVSPFGTSSGAAAAVVATGGRAASAPASSGTDGGGGPATPASAVATERTAALARSRTMASPFAAARSRAAAAAAAAAAGAGSLSRTGSGTPSSVATPAASFNASPGAASERTGASPPSGQPSRQPSAQPCTQPSVQPSAASSRGGPGLSSTSTTGSGHLPELAAHVAECDAAMSWGGDGGGGGLAREHSLIQPSSLPSSLRDLIVDIDDIEFLFWPSGALMELGSGASASVFKVMFRGEVVAAKEVDLGRSPAVQQLFVQEAERLHQLRHAHVVALYGVALSGPRGIILMEYCSGRDLHSALQLKIAGTQRRLFGWYDRGCHVALDIAKALNFLHSKGCVHMDIKSSNVLLTGSGTAKLADIGLARLQQGTHLSDLPKACGTFAWMAPEVIMGSRCTTAVDIFSFGVVLWELITGETPKRGEMRLPEVPAECPREAADLVTRCMSLEPRDRPTAQQLMQQLAAMRGRKRAGRGGAPA